MNPSDQRFTDRVFKRIAKLEQQMQDLKNPQPVGADSLPFINSTEISGSIPVGANTNWWRTFGFYGQIADKFVSELGMRFYIDNDNDNNYRLPLGDSLSVGQYKCYVSAWHDHKEDVSGFKYYHVNLVNGDVAAHTFYYHIILTLSKGALVT